MAGARPNFMVGLLGVVDDAGVAAIARDTRKTAARNRRTARRGRWRFADRIRRSLSRSGDGFSAIWDPKGADFAMMLGEFYCAKLDAPVVLEIVRDGIVYARVYDIRGRSVSTLLRYPSANT